MWSKRTGGRKLQACIERDALNSILRIFNLLKVLIEEIFWDWSAWDF
jgi:hypothetical protein